jgi:hypothetical protein
MGALRRKRITDERGDRSYIDTMEIGVTVDERIADGFYFTKSMAMLQEYLNNPEKLMEVPVLPAASPSTKEVRKKRRAARKARRRTRRDLRKSA